MQSKFFFWATAIVACLFFPLSLTAAEYTVGGDGADYATLETLRTAGVLRNNDIIILNGDDDSLTVPLTYNLTIQGTGKIADSSIQFKNSGNLTLNTDSLEFSNFNTTGNGGVIRNGTTTIEGGTNMFMGNSSGNRGGVINGTATIKGGTNTFIGNMANRSGAIDGTITISGGENTFTENSANTSGGMIYGNTTISGGTNTFTSNSAGTNGGAIAAWQNCNITGGTNTFLGNVASTIGGAISSNDAQYGGVSITGGTNTFLNNKAGSNGGAIYASNSTTLRATNGDFTFRGNRDGVGTANEKANALYTGSALTLAAGEGQNIFFYDPVTTGTSTNRTININNLATDTGKVVFDGSDYDRAIDRFSSVYGNTTVGYGELALKGNVIYGAAPNVGSFTLGENATLTSDETTNRIQANVITLNGTVEVAEGGSLILAADSNVHLNGALKISGGSAEPSFSVSGGNLTYGSGASLDLVWGGGSGGGGGYSPGTPREYDFDYTFGAKSVSGQENLTFKLEGSYNVGKDDTWELNFRDGLGGFTFNGLLNIALGFDEFGNETHGVMQLVSNRLFFGTDAVLNMYWDDALFAPEDGWSYEYSFFGSSVLYGLENLNITMNGFNEYTGFSYIINYETGILTLSYSAGGMNEVPEPATLLVLGLGLAGLPVVRRWRKG